MQIEFQWKTGESNVGNCPARYKAPGGYVIQGKRLDAGTRPGSETSGRTRTPLFVPSDVVDGPGASRDLGSPMSEEGVPRTCCARSSAGRVPA